MAFLAAAVSTPLGMLASYPFISRISESILGALLSLSAGSLVYVGASHLLPQSEAEEKRFSLVALGTAILIAVVVLFSKG